MANFLIAQEGLLSGTILTLDDGTSEWVIGRDADVASLVIEDPTVSRKHLFVRREDGALIAENLSLVSPSRLNGRLLEEPTVLKEGDILQLGNAIFLFSHQMQSATPSSIPDEPLLSFFHPVATRWMIKVISGTQIGAEFPLEMDKAYTLGKDPQQVDICFYDASISKQHARLEMSESGIFIEDLGSRNGTLINGAPTTGRTPLESGDLLTLGTSSMLLIDREGIEKTIYAPSPSEWISAKTAPAVEVVEEVAALPTEPESRDWRDIFIPTRHLIFAFSGAALMLVGCVALISLFHSQPVQINTQADSELVHETLSATPYVVFSYNPVSGKLFLTGHVLTRLDHDQLIYKLKNLSFIQSIDNNVVIDEQVWDSINALLTINEHWRSVFLQSTRPGLFVVRGYVASQDDLASLNDYLALNFPYQDKLQSQVFVASDIEVELQNLLLTKGFSAVTFQFSNGDAILSGRVGSSQKKEFDELLTLMQKIDGVRLVKNLVAFTSDKSSRVDLSQKYTVNGYSEIGGRVDSVLIQGRIYRSGDIIDGMNIVALKPGEVELEKEGVQFRIQYS